MTLEEITEAVQSATSPEEATAIYFAASIKDRIEFNKYLDASCSDDDQSSMEYPTEDVIEALQQAMIDHLPMCIQAYADHPVDMARRAGFALKTTDFDPDQVMDQLIALAKIAPGSNIRRFLPSGTLRLLPNQVILNQRPIWSKEN